MVAIFGGRSEIGLDVARRLAPGNTVVLASRPGGERPDVPGAARVVHVDFDADAVTTHADVVDAIEADAGSIDIAVLTFGILGDQAKAEADPAEVVRIIHTDFTAQASLLTVLADRMRARGAGTLVASLASLITFREYTKHVKGQMGRFMVLFSAISFGFLGVLLVAMTLWMR